MALTSRYAEEARRVYDETIPAPRPNASCLHPRNLLTSAALSVHFGGITGYGEVGKVLYVPASPRLATFRRPLTYMIMSTNLGNSR